MTAFSLDLPVDFLSHLFVRAPLAFSPVEACLFAQALGRLSQPPHPLAFQLAFEDVIPGGNADGRQYARLRIATQRLMQAVNDKRLQPEGGTSHYVLVFSTLGLNANTAQVTGKFNPDLKAQLLDLAGQFSTPELEALLRRR